jgi:hypothetical protein
MTKAYMMLCDVGVIVQCDVPHDVMHCCLKNTTHAEDQSRNHTNFSRVSGP